MDSPIIVPSPDGKVLRIGVERGLVQFWVLPEEEGYKANPAGGWLVLIQPRDLSDGIADREYEGESWKRKPRSMITTSEAGRTKVRVHTPDDTSGESVTVDSKALASAVSRTLNRIVPRGDHLLGPEPGTPDPSYDRPDGKREEGTDKPNPYEELPPYEPAKPWKIGPEFWLILWLVGGLAFGGAFRGGDPFSTMVLMTFGGVSFFMGTLFARTKEKDTARDQPDPIKWEDGHPR